MTSPTWISFWFSNVIPHSLKTEINDEKLKHVAFTYVKLSGDGAYLDVYVDC